MSSSQGTYFLVTSIAIKLDEFKCGCVDACIISRISEYNYAITNSGWMRHLTTMS